jgi:hypothetical protein
MKKLIMAIGLIAVASCSKKEQPVKVKNVAYVAHVTKFNNGVTWVYVENPNFNNK